MRQRAVEVVGILLALVVAGAAAREARADGQPEERGADAVLAAVAAKDAATLRELASAAQPDPWLIADALLARGETEAVRALAAAARGPAVEGLPAYVEREAALGVDGKARAAHDEVVAAFARGDPAGLLQRLAAAEAFNERGDVGAIRRRALHGSVLVKTGGDPRAGQRLLDLAIRDALRIGWLRRALYALRMRAAAAMALEGGVAPALVWLEEALLLARRIGDKALVVELQQQLATGYGVSEDPGAAEASLLRLIARQEAAGDKTSLAWSLAGLGYLHMQRGQLQASRAAFARAAAQIEAGVDGAFDQFLGLGAGFVLTGLDAHREALVVLARARAAPDPARLATSGIHWQIGVALTGLEQFDRARPELEQAIAVARATGDKPGIGVALASLAIVEQHLGAWRAARRHLEEAQRLATATSDKHLRATVLTNLGVVLQGLGEYDEARAHLLAAQAAHERWGNRLGSAAVLSGLGGLDARLGNLPEALAAIAAGRALCADLGESLRVAGSWINEGIVCEKAGAYARSLAALEQARTLLAGRPSTELHALLEAAFAAVFESFGDYERAGLHYRAARDAQKSLGDAHALANAEGSLAGLALEAGDLVAARRGYMAAGAAALASGDRSLVARLRLSLVRVDVRAGRREGLAGRLNELAQAFAATGEILEVGHVHLQRAELEELGGSLPAAEEHARAALDAYEQAGTKHRRFGVLTYLARLRLAQGDAAGAATRTLEAVALLPALGAALAEDEGTRLRSRLAQRLDVGLGAALALEDPALAHTVIESVRAGTLLESLTGRREIQRVRLPAELHAAEARARAREAAAQRYLRAAARRRDLDERRAAQAALKEARRVRSAVLARIQREQKATATLLHPQPADLAGVQAGLRPDEALISFHLGPQRAAALVVTPGEARLVDLGASAAITAACMGLRAVDEDDDIGPHVAALRARTLAPLQLPADARTLLISPDGALAEVPLGLLAPHRLVALVPSASVYLRVLRPEAGLRGEGVLALADPDYETATRRPVPGASRGERLVSLPATRKEAQALGTDLLLGREATEDGLRRRLARRPRWRSVHLACHGLVRVDRPMLSCLAVTADDRDDGRLTVGEIFQWRIPADLVVLSACESARGAVQPGEGVLGLPRAFLFAGTPRVLSSCWKVDDEATRALMVKFYELWSPKDGAGGVATADALRQAQAFVRGHETWRHPYYWAAWVLWGIPD